MFCTQGEILSRYIAISASKKVTLIWTDYISVKPCVEGRSALPLALRLTFLSDSVIFRRISFALFTIPLFLRVLCSRSSILASHISARKREISASAQHRCKSTVVVIDACDCCGDKVNTERETAQGYGNPDSQRYRITEAEVSNNIYIYIRSMCVFIPAFYSGILKISNCVETYGKPVWKLGWALNLSIGCLKIRPQEWGGCGEWRRMIV